MARHKRASKIENRTARLSGVWCKPYFVPIAPRIGLGYRRNQTAGAWVARAADGHGGNWTKAFAIADDHEEANGESVLNFWQAQDRAREIARRGEGPGDRPRRLPKRSITTRPICARASPCCKRQPRPLSPT